MISTPMAINPSSSRAPARLSRYPLAIDGHSDDGRRGSLLGKWKTRLQDSSVMSISFASVSKSASPLVGVGVLGGFPPGVETRPEVSGETVCAAGVEPGV